MALILYSQYLTFPSGMPASNYPFSVTVRASNQLAPLFTDAAGTTPANNPFTTDGDGLISFYAAPGDYETLLAGTFQRIPLDSSVTDAVWGPVIVHEQTTPASVWSVHHCFGIKPSVDVVTDSGETAAEVDHADDLNTTITFGSPTTGTAYLRR